mmetsp:Transcript_32756/g.51200  ORF Transcript_32756/g.51200 Transcript_32756/m.51200 type:complete len:350 (-) Transcript_32756:40-1089(-)
MATPEQNLLWWSAGVFVIYTCLIGSFQIIQHLLHYTVPEHQKYIVRILIMVPVYALDSWFALRFVGLSVVITLVRECYEAYVLYSFFLLLVNYLEGEDQIITIFESKPPIPHPWPFNAWTFQPSSKFYYQCKTLILQFVLVEPILALLTFVLSFTGGYSEGDFSPSNGYLWIMLISNASISVCLYYLVLFWCALDEELEAFSPVGKFLCIKAVIFFAFWQGVFFAILVAIGAIPSYQEISPDTISLAIQDYILCIEMFFLSIGFLVSFPYFPYSNPHTSLRELRRINQIGRSTSDVFNVTDTIEETKETFHPDRLSENFGVVGSIRDRLSAVGSPVSQPPREEDENMKL